MDTTADSLLLHADEFDADTRLDAYLTTRIDGWSRSRLQRLIEDGDVLVNGHTVKPAYKLRPEDEIEVELTPPPSTAFTPEDIPLEIIFEDDDLIVVNNLRGWWSTPLPVPNQAPSPMLLLITFSNYPPGLAMLDRASSIAWTKTHPACWSLPKTKDP